MSKCYIVCITWTTVAAQKLFAAKLNQQRKLGVGFKPSIPLILPGITGLRHTRTTLVQPFLQISAFTWKCWLCFLHIPLFSTSWDNVRINWILILAKLNYNPGGGNYWHPFSVPFTPQAQLLESGSIVKNEGMV